MFDTFTRDNAGDFQQRYQGSYGKYINKEKDTKVLVYFTSVGEERVDFIDAGGNSYRVEADSGETFEFSAVKKKVFVHDDKLFLVRRFPDRQWKRGLNNANTHIVSIPKSQKQHIGFSKAAAAMAVNHHYPVSVLFELEAGKATAAALSDQFGVLDNILYLYNIKVGEVRLKEKEIKVTEEIFKQEVADLLEKNYIPYKLV